MKVEIKLEGFNDEDFYGRALLDMNVNKDIFNPSPNQIKSKSKKIIPTHYTQRTVYDSLSGHYYVLIIFNSLILIYDDVAIQIKTAQTPNAIEPMKFKYWLSARFVKQQVGKVNRMSVRKNLNDNQHINLSEMVYYEDPAYAEL